MFKFYTKTSFASDRVKIAASFFLTCLSVEAFGKLSLNSNWQTSYQEILLAADGAYTGKISFFKTEHEANTSFIHRNILAYGTNNLAEMPFQNSFLDQDHLGVVFLKNHQIFYPHIHRHDLGLFYSKKATLGGLVAYTAKDHEAFLIVSFRGTESFEDILTDADGLRKRSHDLFNLPGLSHSGFFLRYVSLRENLFELLLMFLSAHKNDGIPLKIIVTGHSLGGALANLAAMDIKRNLAPELPIKLITFCAPRIFDQEGALGAKHILGVNNMLRVIRKFDPVTSLGFGIQEGIKGWFFNSFQSYEHAPSDIFVLPALTKGMSFKNHDLFEIFKESFDEKIILSQNYEK